MSNSFFERENPFISFVSVLIIVAIIKVQQHIENELILDALIGFRGTLERRFCNRFLLIVDDDLFNLSLGKLFSHLR